MANFNLTPSGPLTVNLNGIPGLEAAHIWISIPFSTLYIITLLGNFLVLFVVCKEQTLHKPMYLLLCMLALTDIGISTSFVPKALGIFWFGFKDITMDGCLTQIFFLPAVAAMHSAVLMTMAFDRYVAICDPLRYATILTNELIAKLGLAGLIRAVLLILPHPFLMQKLPFCANHVIPHMYCELMAVAKLSCADTTVNSMFMVIPLGISMSDLTFIGVSYGLIIRAVLRISSKKAHQKAFKTCMAHICVMLISYTSFLVCVLTRHSQGIPVHIRILLANVFLLVPPMINPIIYGVTTKELGDKVREYICLM